MDIGAKAGLPKREKESGTPKNGCWQASGISRDVNLTYEFSLDTVQLEAGFHNESNSCPHINFNKLCFCILVLWPDI